MLRIVALFWFLGRVAVVWFALVLIASAVGIAAHNAWERHGWGEP